MSRRNIFKVVSRGLVAVAGCLMAMGVVGLNCGQPQVPDNTPGNSGITGQYVGSTRCTTCHANIHDNWSKTLHAKALATLENIGQGENSACLPCHTVGFGEAGGFVNRLTTNDLADVGCESCHGPGRNHVSNVSDPAMRPPVSLAGSLCGKCHTGSHHPNFEQWEESKHAAVVEELAERFELGTSLNSCGKCHSGDFFYNTIIKNRTMADNALQGVPPEQMTGVSCAICHNPHAKTGNAPTPEDGRDFQLRFPEVANPTPTNTIDATTNPQRFNLCGQCHHDRGRTWKDTARGPHYSVQANVYTGEMALPNDDDTPLVLSRVSVHSFATEQCATCHMYRQDFQSAQAPAISGHGFTVNLESCATSGCHPSTGQANAVKATLQTEIQTRLDNIRSRLGAPATWEYSANGGPNNAGQAALPDEIKQARYLYYYALEDGSLGIHNPAYVRDMLIKADTLLTNIGK